MRRQRNATGTPIRVAWSPRTNHPIAHPSERSVLAAKSVQ